MKIDLTLQDLKNIIAAVAYQRVHAQETFSIDSDQYGMWGQLEDKLLKYLDKRNQV